MGATTCSSRWNVKSGLGGVGCKGDAAELGTRAALRELLRRLL